MDTTALSALAAFGASISGIISVLPWLFLLIALFVSARAIEIGNNRETSAFGQSMFTLIGIGGFILVVFIAYTNIKIINAQSEIYHSSLPYTP